jgi:hypothetical protein
MSSPAVLPNRPTRALVVRAQLTLGMTHRRFGEALGSSERTSLRWAKGSSSVTVSQLRKLAALVHPRDSALAAEIAHAASETLESLGVVAPPPPPQLPPRARRLAPHLIADLVVCAAADALGAAPGATRGALMAAFARAAELELSVAEVVEALGRPSNDCQTGKTSAGGV